MSRPLVPLTSRRINAIFRLAERHLARGELGMVIEDLKLLSGKVRPDLTPEEKDRLGMRLAIFNKLIDEASEKAGHVM